MPLDVMTGPPPAVGGSGPPGPGGPSDTGPATGDPAALFAALLAQQGQTAPAILPKATGAVLGTAQETDTGKDDKTDPSDPPQPSTQGQIDPTAINWAALAALQMPVPAQNARPTGDTPVSSAPTMQKEVMDTDSLSVPAAPAAKTDTASSGLLPLSTVPQAQPDALSTAMTGGAAAAPVVAAPVVAAPLVAVPDASQAVPAVVSNVQTSDQIALQNNAVPANNTGNTETSKTAASLKPNPVKAAIAADRQGKQGQALPQGDVLKSARQSAAGDRSPQAGRKSEGDHSADNPAVPPQLTGTASAEPRVSTTAAAEKPLTGAERAQIIRQAADGIGAVKPQVMAAGQGQMTLHLHPKEWGDLRVTVQLAPAPATADGVKQTAVVAHVVASSPAVKTALEQHSGDLNQAMRETGLHLERLTVTVQAASAGEQSGAAGDGRNFGQRSQDPWQGQPSQTSNGNGGLGAGGSSSFASQGERQGGHAFQSQSASRSAYAGGDEGETTLLPVSNYSNRQSAGFDQRA